MKREYSITITVLFFVILTGLTYGQKNYGNSIKGTVIDKMTNKPIEGCTFFLSQTGYFSVTDAKGNFEIKNIIPGSYTPVFSCKNYVTQMNNLYFNKDQEYVINGSLDPLPANELAWFNSPKSSDHSSDFDKFERIFIGDTPYRGSCKVENPDVMNFKRNEDILAGKSNGFLTFKHTKFGYKIHCVIIAFSYNTKQLTKGIDYSVYFEDMTPKDEDEKEDWEDYRKEAYIGSINHFLWTLRNDKLKDEDYELFAMRSLGPEAFSSDGMDDASNASTQFQNRIMSFKEMQMGDVDENQTMFTINGFLKVVHRPRSYSRETSFLQVPSQATMTLDKEGWTDIDMPFTYYGLWGRNGISNLLPKEYRIKNQ